MSLCNGLYQSGPRKGQPCESPAWFNGCCGRHQAQVEINDKMITCINNTDEPINIYRIESTPCTCVPTEDNQTGPHHHHTFFHAGCFINPYCYKHINIYNYDISQYIVVYKTISEHELLDYHISVGDLIPSPDESKNLWTFIVPNPKILDTAKYKNLYESWKKVALKALHLPKDIKKLTDSDTVKEMCDMTEYIDLPEEITERDFQLAGATYNPDDEYIPPDDENIPPPDEPVWTYEVNDSEDNDLGHLVAIDELNEIASMDNQPSDIVEDLLVDDHRILEDVLSDTELDLIYGSPDIFNVFTEDTPPVAWHDHRPPPRSAPSQNDIINE